MHIPVFDGHNDTLLNLYLKERGQGRSFFERSEIGHIDLPRAQEGGLAGGFFAMFTPTPAMQDSAKKGGQQGMVEQFLKEKQQPVDRERALRMTMDMAGLMYRLERESGGTFKVVLDVDELQTCLDRDVMAAIFHIEGAEAIDPELDTLYTLYSMGLRSLGPVWSRPNAFGHGVPFDFPSTSDLGPGLTDAGKALVRTCNALGILIDLSHLNEKGFWDVHALTDAPLVATHSNVYAICPSARNLTDRQMDAVKESGGVVGLNFHVGFLRPDGVVNTDTPLQVMCEHLVYMADRMGVDHVALGSDFDGARMPDDLADASRLPALLEALHRAGFQEEDLHKIAYKNWLRVLKQTWK